MLKMFKGTTAAVFLTLGLAMAPAFAGSINGSITVSDGIAAGSLGGDTAVSGLLSITHNGPGAPSGCSLLSDYSAQASCPLSATMTDWIFAGPYGVIVRVDGWTFAVSSALSVGSFFSCAFGNCSDTQMIAMTGVATGNSFDPTLFTGTLLLSGGCKESGTAGTGHGLGATPEQEANARRVRRRCLYPASRAS